MKFLVPNYSCLQNPWLGGYRPQIPVLSVLCPQLNLLNPPRTKFLGTPLTYRIGYRIKKCALSWYLEKVCNRLVLRRVRKIVKKRQLASSCLFVRPSALNKSVPTGTDIHENLYMIIFRKYVKKKIQVSLISNQNNGHFKWNHKDIFDHISLNSP